MASVLPTEEAGECKQGLLTRRRPPWAAEPLRESSCEPVSQWWLPWIAVLLVVGSSLSCAPAGNRQTAVLAERAKYKVELLSWVGREDGKIVATLRVDGPVRSRLQMLTVEIVRFGADGERIGSDWVTLDLRERVGGVSFEKTVVLPADPMPAALGVDLHPQPLPEILPRLKELQRPTA